MRPVYLLAAVHLLLACDYTMLYLALPALSAESGLNGADAQWVMHGYTVAFGGFMLASGRAADLYGARRVLVSGLLVLAAGSLLGGASTGALSVVLGRFVQGLGAAICFPSMLVLIGQGKAGAAGRAIAIWSAAGPCGLAAGTALGGLLLEWSGWRSIFHLNVPLAAILALAVVHAFPPDGEGRSGGSLSLRNAAAGASALILLLASLVQVPTAGWASAQVLGLAAIAGVLLRVLVRIERSDPQPLLPPALLGNRDLQLAMALTGGIMGTFMALPYFQTQLYQHVYGLSAVEAGLGFLVPCFSQAAGSRLSGPLTSRIGVHLTIVGGLTAGAACLVGAGAASAKAVGLMSLLPWLTVAGFGQGLAWSATWLLAGSAAPARQQGSASALVSTAFQVGGALGLCVLVLATLQLLGAEALDLQALPAANATACYLAAGLITVLAAATARRWQRQRHARG